MNNTKIVPVKASTSYDITIGSGILTRCGEILSNIKKPCRAVVITDSNVDELYADTVMNSLANAGYPADKYVFPAGETSKSAATFVDILEFLASEKITRSDVLIALGGGVVGDITGFAAACYLRGIDFVQIPTTLLAAVDSSVGGKTAIDLDAGKNLAGAFYQPIAVICDTDTFDTLPEKEIACGYAEVIKYGILFDENFVRLLMNGKTEINETVEKCVTFKRDVVERDEFDNGERKLLNLGHTAAHGIEKVSLYSLTHGQAVSVGMVIATKIAENFGICEKNTHKEIEKLLTRYNLPVKYDISASQLCLAALSDKKRGGERLTLVLPERIGKCVLYDVNVDDLEEIFSKAL